MATKRLLGAQYPLLKAHGLPALASSSATVQESLPRTGESHDEKNARLNRPMSPHLTIYKFQMTTVLSITHRITGCALSVYAVALAGAALTMPHDFNHAITALEAMHPGTLSILTAKFMVGFPFMYHTCNGVRHLMWDTGKQLNKHAVVTTGSVMLAATLATTLLIMFM